MARFDLTDTQFSRLLPLLPPEHSGQPGHPYNEHRPVINGILWVLRAGAPWRDLPERYGPWQTCYDRFARWQKDGTWGRVLEALQTEQPGDPAEAAREVFADSTTVKAHPHAAGARRRTAKPLKKGGRDFEPAAFTGEALGRSRGGLSTKIHLACDGKARPVSLVLSAGQVSLVLSAGPVSLVLSAGQVSLVLSAGQESDSNYLEPVVRGVRLPRAKGAKRGRPRTRPRRVTADKGYSYPKCRRLLRGRGIASMIPERRDQREQRQKKGRRGGRPCAYRKEVYRLRNLVERCVLRLKQFRRVATRYEKRAYNYLAFVTLAAIMVWLR